MHPAPGRSPTHGNFGIRQIGSPAQSGSRRSTRSSPSLADTNLATPNACPYPLKVVCSFHRIIGTHGCVLKLSSKAVRALIDGISLIGVRGREMGLDDPFPIEKCSG